MQTCHSCAKKLAERRVEKRTEREPSNVPDSPSKGGNRKGPQPRGTVLRACLSWSEFIGLVSKHKDDAFELDAEVDLKDLSKSECCASGNSDIARRIAEETWKATCYRFMLVNTFFSVYH
jgi:hypothetical protein